MLFATTCEICGLTYCPGISADARQHNKLHRATLEAAALMKDVGPTDFPTTYEAREALKHARPGQDPQEHALLVMWSHFARSLAAANYALSKHPTWQRYARAYVAQPHFQKIWGAAITDRLVTKFGIEPSPFLPNGYSCWRKYTPTQARRYSGRASDPVLICDAKQGSSE